MLGVGDAASVNMQAPRELRQGLLSGGAAELAPMAECNMDEVTPPALDATQRTKQCHSLPHTCFRLSTLHTCVAPRVPQVGEVLEVWAAELWAPLQKVLPDGQAGGIKVCV